MEKRISGSFACIRKENKLLMILRKFPPYANHWSLPGGAVEKDENPKEAVIREVKEETSLSILVRNYLGNIYFVGDHDPSKYYKAEVYDCKLLEENVKAGKEIYDVKWIDENQIFSLKLAKPMEEFYKKLLSTSHRPISVFLS